MPAAAPPSAADRIRSLWATLSRWPGGKWLFSTALSWYVPYTGSVRPYVERLEAGDVRVRVRERFAIRNHLRSIHALALANVGELASGLAVAASLPPGYRFIVTRLEVQYLAKARGTVVAVSDFKLPDGEPPAEVDVPVRVLDAAGTEVVRVTVGNRIGPTRSGAAG